MKKMLLIGMLLPTVGVYANVPSYECESLSDPQDVSYAIVNPTFDLDSEGWSGDVPYIRSGVAEFFNRKFTLSQELTDMPNGVYMLRVQAFYSPGTYDNAWSCFRNGDTHRHAMLFASTQNDTITAPIVNMWHGIEPNVILNEGSQDYCSVRDEEGATYWGPRTISSAALFFETGYYKDNQVLFGVNNGKMTIGLTKSELVDYDMTDFDNFRLFYLGTAAEAYQYWLDWFLEGFDKTLYDDDNLLVTQQYVDDYKSAIEVATIHGSDYEAVISIIDCLRTSKKAVDDNISAWQLLLDCQNQGYEILNSVNTYRNDYLYDLEDYLYDVEDALACCELTTEYVLLMYATLKQKCYDAVINIPIPLPNGIEAVIESHNPASIRYSLDGRRVGEEHRGIVIEGHQLRMMK